MAAQAVSHITDSTFVSNLDIHKPQVLNEMFLSHGSEGIAYLMTRSLGFEKPVMGDTYSHFESKDTHDKIKVRANVIASLAGAFIEFDLDPTSLDNDTVANRPSWYYPRLGDQILFHDEVVGWVYSITVVDDGLGAGIDTVTLKVFPNSVTDILGPLTAGDELVIISDTWSQGSGMPDPAISGCWKYENDAKIIKEAIGATGTELVNETWIDMYNEAGEFQGYYRKGQKEIDYRMLTKIDGMFWFGKRIDNTAGRAIDPITGYPVMDSEGLIPGIRRLGHVYTYVPGALANADINALERILVKEFIPSTVPIWTALGLELYQEVETIVATYLQNTNVDYTRKVINDMLFASDESLGVSINFKYLQKSGRMFMFHPLYGFSNPNTYGAVGYSHEKQGVMIPIEKRKDPVNGGDISTIGTRYRAMGAYNRRMITETLAGVGASGRRIPVHTIDKTNTYMLAHMGNEFFGLNRNILIDV